MTPELVVLLAGRRVGLVRSNPKGRLTFTYDPAWSESRDAYPLSLTMPIAAAEHGSTAIETFIWGLLPDNEQVLERWAMRFQVSAHNPFALIANVGEDCAGAVQFVRPERLEEVQGGGADRVDWLEEAEIADRLRLLRKDHAAWRLPRDTGQFSLAGAQPKTALLFEKGSWGIPSGRLPTTHILKPSLSHFDGHAENEHACLALARALGMPAARSRVERFGRELAIVVERYDRLRFGEGILRVHQVDMCQALAVLPVHKYQNEGGPGIGEIIELLRTHSTQRGDDIQTFLDGISLNWLIAGTDAHAKNYSLLLGGGPFVRLAPLYDVASILPYDEFHLPKVKLSMKIGEEYRLGGIGLRQWKVLAKAVRIDESRLLDRLVDMARRVPDAIHDVREATLRDGLAQPMLEKLETRLVLRAQHCLRLLQSS